MDNLPHLYLRSRGFFQGQFVITIQDRVTFSIGDYIEVVLRAEAFDTGERYKVGPKEGPIIALHVMITECCQTDPIEAVIRGIPGPTLGHLTGCLNVGVPSVMMSFKYEHRGHVWYMSKIDGWVPGLFGRSKAP